MDHQFVTESVAHQLAKAWETHRTPAFAEYILQTFGCEPLKPAEFAGIFSLQMIGGYFYPDLPAGPGPVVERLWRMDDTGFHPSSMEELQSVENLESDNPLVIYDPSRTSHEQVIFQPLLFAYPQFRFFIKDDRLIYHEQFGFRTVCKKVAKIVISDRVSIQDVRVTWTIWQGRGKDVTPL